LTLLSETHISGITRDLILMFEVLNKLLFIKNIVNCTNNIVFVFYQINNFETTG